MPQTGELYLVITGLMCIVYTFHKTKVGKARFVLTCYILLYTVYRLLIYRVIYFYISYCYIQLYLVIYCYIG